MNIINIPKDGTSDTKVKLIEIFKNNGEEVSVGELLCEIETSKAVAEIESQFEGYVYFLYKETSEIEVGSPICIVSDSLFPEKNLIALKDKLINKEKPQSERVISEKAKVLIEKHDINVDSIPGEVISEKIIINYIAKMTLKEKVNYSFKENDIAIYGIGGHAGMCIDIVLKNEEFNLVGFIDDNKTNDSDYNLNFLGDINDLEHLIDCGLKNLIIGIGFINDLKEREKIFESIHSKLNIPSIIHPSAIIEDSAIVKNGCQIMAGAIIGSNVIVGENCIINSGAIVSHNAIIDNTSHITPGATIAGHVSIGKRVTVGMCATVYIGLSISNDTVINNNESIIQNI